MKQLYITIACCCTLLTFTGCDAFLDVQPEDRLTREQIQASESAINQSLTGIYVKMAQGTLYGANLTMTIVECLGQQYNLSNQNHTYYWYGQYGYEQENVKTAFASLWTQMYVQILNVNEFMEMVNNMTVTIPEERKNMLLGEAYALRAFLHFDLLRLYGPVYNTPDSTSIDAGIVYNDLGGGELVSKIAPNEFMDKVLADLQRAETLLANDPVKTQGGRGGYNSDPLLNFYQSSRQYRMNYYAVKALQARAWLWRNNKQQALAAAREVINAQLGNIFPWVTKPAIQQGANPDRVFSSEVLFGIENRDLYNNHNRYFDGGLEDNNILAPLSARLEETYEGLESDFRNPYIWKVPASGGKEYKTFFKYDRPTNVAETSFSYFQPLIRISEVYYIAAECVADINVEEAKSMLQTVCISRNIEPTIISIDDQLKKEYRKEFYGEGQLFYYYKRKADTNLPNGNADSGFAGISLSQFVVPVPDAELGYTE